VREVSREVAQWLATEGAEEALASLVGRDLSDRSLMGLVMELRERFTAEQAGALIDQARLRQKGREKFGEAALRMLFVEEALQQASGRRIATYRAQRYRPYSHIADLGCGIGGDALALSEVAEDLLALDLDPVRLFFAGHNLRVAGGGARVTLERADWTGYAYPPNVQAAFARSWQARGGAACLLVA
jgi:methylase of polypeptide subunit release factors